MSGCATSASALKMTKSRKAIEKIEAGKKYRFVLTAYCYCSRSPLSSAFRNRLVLWHNLSVARLAVLSRLLDLAERLIYSGGPL